MRRSGDLSAQQRSLLEMMRMHQFGRVENMRVRAGQPILDHDVRVVSVARLGGENTTNQVASEEYELKRPVRDLFDRLAAVAAVSSRSRSFFYIPDKTSWGAQPMLDRLVSSATKLG